ncbi:MAG: LysR family transcriptional regulator [Cyanobacteria bacterium P01_D01_bin.36]
MTVWDGISELLMVVETGSFTAASKRLGVSTSHVSRQVARLEERLGVKLLTRSTRVVRLTDAGAAYHAKVAYLATAIDEANQSAAGADADLAGRIRVSAAGVFAEEIVAPLLARFAHENPRISIQIDFNTKRVNLIDLGFDFAIRYGVLADSELTCRKLAVRRMVCAASPEFLERNGTPQHPSELGDYDCLPTNQDRWRFCEPKTGEPIDVRIRGRWIANNGRALREGAISGLGIAYAPSENLASAIDAGLLVSILSGYEDTSRFSWIVFPGHRYMPLRVRRAIDYISGAVGVSAIGEN